MSGAPIDTERATGFAATAPLPLSSLPDESLLDRFLNEGESAAQEAFEALVRRHGPMVLGVCRHILPRVHDAEDAFQATFLVLARKAGAIRDGRVLGRWLYEVAYRIAVRSKGLAARRRTLETQGAEMTSFAPSGASGGSNDPAWNELRPVLHEEINRLPEKYRDAVVLCYLEGLTNEEAAALLGWPVGTVKGRLSRARELLRSRLTRRGLALSAALLALRLSQNTVFAEVVSARLARSTARAAVRIRQGGEAALLADPLATLVDEGLRAPEAMAAGVRGAAATALVLVVLAALLGGGLTLLIRGGGLFNPGGVLGPPGVFARPSGADDAPAARPAAVADAPCARDL